MLTPAVSLLAVLFCYHLLRFTYSKAAIFRYLQDAPFGIVENLPRLTRGRRTNILNHSQFYSLPMPEVIQLFAATAAENIQALEEVKDFATTDMGRGGPGRWTYRILREPELTEKLKNACNPRCQGHVDTVSFQPCPNYEARSQDRLRVEEWNLPGGSWTFTAVFDGHMNHDTVEHVSSTLPDLIRRSLKHCLGTNSQAPLEHVSKILSEAISSIDTSIISACMDILPGGEKFLSSASEDTIKQLINDTEKGSEQYTRLSRVLGGTTALVTLLDPSKEHLWVGNLGDGFAVLGSKKNDNKKEWRGTLLNSIHNGNNVSELQRVRNEHPGEASCVIDNRVLGWLAPTRAIGDAWLKMPSIYLQRMFLHLEAPWLQAHSLENYIGRIKTPPYVSSEPEIHHHRVRRTSARDVTSDYFLITCSDGLPDICPGNIQATIDRWVQVVGSNIDTQCNAGRERGTKQNLAMCLLRDSIGGEDTQTISRNLTVEMEERWMDDITIIVQTF